MNKLLIIAFLGVSTLSCAQNPGKETSVEVAISDMDGKQQRVSKEQFKSYLEVNPSVQLVDVRTPSEYNSGKIGSAINFDFNGHSFEQQLEQLDKSKPVMIYCASGGRSGKTLDMMKGMGFTTVLELEGGYNGWK
jgi:rhodanese-related sulfurtransferase